MHMHVIEFIHRVYEGLIRIFNYKKDCFFFKYLNLEVIQSNSIARISFNFKI